MLNFLLCCPFILLFTRAVSKGRGQLLLCLLCSPASSMPAPDPLCRCTACRVVFGHHFLRPWALAGHSFTDSLMSQFSNCHPHPHAHTHAHGPQVDSVLSDFPVGAVKTGMLPSAEAVQLVAAKVGPGLAGGGG